MGAGWGLGVVALVAAGGLLTGIALGSAPGARPTTVRALGSALPEPLRSGLFGLAQPADVGIAAPGLGLPPSVEPSGAPVPHTTPAVPRPSPTAPSLPSAAPTSSASRTSTSTPTPTPTPTSTAPTPVDADAPPCAPTARACVDLSTNRSWLLRDGRVTYGPVPITHGRTGFRTPPGTFRVAFKKRDHVSSIYDAEMPWSVFFNGGVAFHEGSLDVLSHGCVHLSPTAAKTFFSTLSVGDVVQVVL